MPSLVRLRESRMQTVQSLMVGVTDGIDRNLGTHYVEVDRMFLLGGGIRSVGSR